MKFRLPYSELLRNQLLEVLAVSRAVSGDGSVVERPVDLVYNKSRGGVTGCRRLLCHSLCCSR